MSIDKLESARELLAQMPSAALKRMPPAASLPAMLRPERNHMAAEAWRAMGYFKEAERLYAKVLVPWVAKEDPPLWLEAALGSAAGHRSIGGVAAAGKLIQAASKLARAEGIRVYADRFALERAMIERAAGRYRASLLLLRPLLEDALKRNAGDEAAFILWAIGGAERFRGDLKASEAAFIRSRILARRAGDRIGEGYAIFGLGGVTRILGRLRESASYYARAARVFRSTDDHFAQAYAYCGCANAQRQLGRLRRAETHYRKSHRLYTRIGDAVDLAYVDWGLGEVRKLRGRTKEAVTFFRRALAAFRRHKEARGEVLASLSLAECLHVGGATPAAERLFRRAYKLSLRSGLHAHLESFT